MPTRLELEHLQDLLTRQNYSPSERAGLLSEAAASDTGLLTVVKVVLDVEAREQRLGDILGDLDELDYERADVAIEDLEAEGTELLERLLPLVRTWLPLLWTVGSENRLCPTLVHHCLALCSCVVRPLRSSLDFAELDEQEGVIVRSRSGKKVYDAVRGGVLLGIVWVWREVLLGAVEIGMGGDAVKEMLRGLMELARESGCSLDQDVLFGTDLKKPTQHFFPNAHWTVGRKAAAERVEGMVAEL